MQLHPDPLTGRGDQISTTVYPETGEESHTKNREIKKGYSPIIQVFKIKTTFRRKFINEKRI